MVNTNSINVCYIIFRCHIIRNIKCVNIILSQGVLQDEEDTDWVDVKWKGGVMGHPLQKDGCSCGIVVVKVS